MNEFKMECNYQNCIFFEGVRVPVFSPLPLRGSSEKSIHQSLHLICTTHRTY